MNTRDRAMYATLLAGVAITCTSCGTAAAAKRDTPPEVHGRIRAGPFTRSYLTTVKEPPFLYVASAGPDGVTVRPITTGEGDGMKRGIFIESEEVDSVSDMPEYNEHVPEGWGWHMGYTVRGEVLDFAPDSPEELETTLKPFRAQRRNAVRVYGDVSAVPDAPNDALAVVFFQGIRQRKRVTPRDLEWRIRDAGGRERPAIGIGTLSQGAIELAPEVELGYLMPGDPGDDLLLALVFAVPASASALTLTDASGREHQLAVEKDWSPPEHQVVQIFEYRGTAFLNLSTAGPGWKAAWPPE